ncbi:unnamed protein product [Penicillium bialowiezense]
MAWRGSFPIHSILDEPVLANQDLFTGALHTNHALALIRDPGGLSDMMEFVEGELQNLCQMVVEGKNSEYSMIELNDKHDNPQQVP